VSGHIAGTSFLTSLPAVQAVISFEQQGTIMETNLNEDIEIWREVPEDYYSPSIHVTNSGKIGLSVGGLVIVKTVRQWHYLAVESSSLKALADQDLDNYHDNTRLD
jgi:hypothetical protein